MGPESLLVPLSATTLQPQKSPAVSSTAVFRQDPEHGEIIDDTHGHVIGLPTLDLFVFIVLATSSTFRLGRRQVLKILALRQQLAI